jgi:class 3 adenylate cyclase
MAAGGLPNPMHGSPESVVQAAMEMQRFMEKRKNKNLAAGKTAFEIRVGIHTGPVIAGIVGIKKFQYDIWGDTVNTASRMETNAEPGKVNISEATYELVKNNTSFSFTERAETEVKGKGKMRMYYVQLAN